MLFVKMLFVKMLFVFISFCWFLCFLFSLSYHGATLSGGYWGRSLRSLTGARSVFR